jgi:hypothetical protein
MAVLNPRYQEIGVRLSEEKHSSLPRICSANTERRCPKCFGIWLMAFFRIQLSTTTYRKSEILILKSPEAPGHE